MKLIETIKWILDSLDLWYFPEISATPAPPIRTSKKKRRTTAAKQRPDNLVLDPDNTARTYTDLEDGREWERWEDIEGRSHEMNDQDRLQCLAADLDILKYGTIKVAWATRSRIGGGYLSAKEASRKLTAEIGRGYGQRTIEKYYSAINKANPSPQYAAAS